MHHGILSYDHMHFDCNLTAHYMLTFDIVSLLGRRVNWGQLIMVSFLNQNCALC